MNKLLQTTLVSAIMATAGFASVEEISTISQGTELNIQGNAVANTPISVAGTLNIQGGTLQNNITITIKKILNEESGSLMIADVFQVGSLVGTVEAITGQTENATLNNITGFNLGYWEFVDSSGNTYSDNGWSSMSNVSIQNGKFQNRIPLTADTYNHAIANLKNFENSGANITIGWTNTADATLQTDTFTQSSTVNGSIDDTSYANCFPTKGVLDFTDATSKGSFTGPINKGTVKLSCNTTANFTGMSATDIIGVYEYNTTNTDYIETVVDGTKYIIAKRLEEKDVYDNAKNTFKSRFKCVTLSESIDPNFYAFGDGSEIGDQRRSYTGLIGSESLNKNENILSTDNIIPACDDTNKQSAIVNIEKENDIKILSVNRGSYVGAVNIKFRFEGSDNLEFKDDTEVNDQPDEDKKNQLNQNLGKITFSGDNSGYTGTASVLGIISITADAGNALPHKLAEDFSSTELVINSGENAIDNERDDATTIKSLQLNGGSLTIASGTSIVIGSNS